MELVVSGVAGATEDHGLGGCRGSPSKAPVAQGTHGGGPNVVGYPSPLFRGVEAGSTRSIMAAGGPVGSVSCEKVSGVMFILPG